MGEEAERAAEEAGFWGEFYPKPRDFSECPVCGRKFKKAVAVKDHIRDVHGKTAPEYKP